MRNKAILKGKLVTLRPLSLKDAPNYCRWFADPEVVIFLDWYHKAPPTLRSEAAWIKKIKKSKDQVVFAIETVEGVHVGSVGLHKIDENNKNAEFGIVIGDKKYWGQGYGTEAGKLMVRYGFTRLKLHRIYLRYIAFNIRGGKSYKKIGFRPEGIYRQQERRGKFLHDMMVMGILRDEWKKISNI